MKTISERIAELSPEKRELFTLLLGNKEPDQSGKTVTAGRRGNGALPLSFAQQRLWFLDQLEPGTAFYNLPAAVRLHGVLDLSALARSFGELVRRHETLRTTFRIVGEQPEQVVSPALAPELPFFDLSHLDVAGREAQVARLAEEETRLPFDLAAGPLLRLRVLRLAEDEHVLLLTLHHIISDGWSMGVLIKEVITLYSAYSQGHPSPLPDLPVQYADYAIWQREYLTGELLEQQLDYWRKQLKRVPVLELPRDRPRRSERRYRGASVGFKLTEELTQSLRELSERAGATLFMTLLAAFQTLLHRYTNQQDISVGTPIANRNRAEIEGLIGFFVNTLVMRTDFSGDPMFGQLLGRVRETALGAYANQDVPFERLVEELQPERDLNHSPLFQVLFTMQNLPAGKTELPGLELEVLERHIQFATFDLSLVVEDSDEGVSGRLTGSLDLFEPEKLHRFVEHYEVLLKSIVADPEQKISQLPILSDAERQRLLVEWNETEREYAPASTLSELFEAQAERSGEAVAVVFEGEQLTYAELNRRANQLAHYLRAQGVTVDDIIGVLMERSVEMIVAVLGILKAGGAYVPLDPSYPRERLAFMVQDAGLRMLLTQEELLNEVPGEYMGQTLSLNQQWDAIAGESVENLLSVAHPENLAYVIYTSGSTGRPKGVLISHENVVCLLEATQPHFEINQNDVWTLFHSYAFDFSVWEIWGALAYGGKLVIVPYWLSRSAEAFHALLVSEQVTVLNQTPSAFRQLMAADESAGDGVELKLRLAIFGGEALELQSLRPWFARHGDHTPRLVNMFGITETTVHVTYRPLTTTDLELASSSVIGRPLECLQVYLLDGYGQPVPIGVAGEVCVGGTGLARGYLNRPELTGERFVPNPFSKSPGARLYKSGDLARFLPNGDMEYLGRIDHQVKVRGFRIELGEIEAALAEHEAVRESTVVASADGNGETKLLAYLVAGRQQPAPSVTALREFLQQKLPEHMIPAWFIVLEAMPLTPNGKIDRKALPAPDQARPELGKEFVAPRTPVEEIVAGIWEQLLDVRPVGVRDDFFSLGGHSLLAVRLMARIQASFGQHLPLASLFQAATIEKLASLLHEQPHDHGASALVAIQPNGEGVPFFCVHPGGGNVLCYNELSNHLGFERPFYGLQARGLAENQIPHTRIEDMAAYYIDAIRTVWPDGPYLLGGWSMGGVIAYEMAQQLEARGQQVSLLALMDARPVTSVDDAAPLDELMLLTNFARDLGLPVDDLQLLTNELAKLDSDQLLSYVLQRAIEAGVVPGDIQLAHARRLFEVFKINLQAMQSYRPEVSSTRVTLLKAGEQEVADETMGWGALTSGEIEIHRIPGSHFTIVREPYVRSLAEQLADCINRATLRSFVSHT